MPGRRTLRVPGCRGWQRLKITESLFEASAFRAEDEPAVRGPLVVFLGRSNVGKSSLINALLGVKGLARTSSTPGRTQTVNFYRINRSFHFVDLPGYGYAKAPDAVRDAWRGMVEGFLARRGGEIASALLVLDARHAPQPLDDVMAEWLNARAAGYVVAATKADKLSGNARSVAARTLAEWAARSGAPAPILVSAETGLGIKELWSRIDPALATALHGRKQGEKWTSAN